MRKIGIVSLLFCLILIACSEKNPLKVDQVILNNINSGLNFQAENLVIDGDYTPGYTNGKIRSNQVQLEWDLDDKSDFLCYKLFKGSSNGSTYINEGFESGNISDFWNSNSYYPWELTSDFSFEGNQCAITGSNSSYNYFDLQTTINVIPETLIQISFTTIELDSSGDGDFYINGNHYCDWDNGYTWTTNTIEYYTGYNTEITLLWRYDSEYYGQACIDAITVYSFDYNQSNIMSTIIDKDISSFTDTTLVQNSSYDYKIAAITTNGTAKIDNITIKTPQWETPTEVSINGTDFNSLDLSWEDNSDTEKEFVIYVEELTGYYDFTVIDTLYNSKNDTLLQISDLNDGSVYRFGVKATGDWEEDTEICYSEICDIPFILAPPINMTLLQNTDYRKSVNLTWIDEANMETGFEIERKINDGVFLPIATLPINTISYTDNDTINFEYHDIVSYRIRSLNNLNDSLYSEWSEITSIELTERLYLVYDFENQIIPNNAELSGDADWYITETDSSHCLRSGEINDYEETIYQMTIDIPQYKQFTIQFDYKVSSEYWDDYLVFYINNNSQNSWSGLHDWNTVSYSYSNYSQETMVLQWKYYKNYSYSENEDCAWIDNIIIIEEEE